MKAKIYNTKGKETGEVKLPEVLFDVPFNADLVHQVATGMAANAREPLAHAKMRGEVRGGGKKPWRQKGTGRARHGSTRSPIWVGGGVTHGPRNTTDFSKKINKKMRDKAFRAVLSQKMRDGEVIFVDALGMKETKTKDAQAMLDHLAKDAGFEKLNFKRGKRALISVPARDQVAEKSFRNIESAFVDVARNLNTLELLTYKYLVIVDPEKSIAALEARVKQATKK